MTKNKLLTAGMAVYCTAVCAEFAALGIPADAVEPLEIEEPKINVQGLTQYVEPIKAETLVHITPEIIITQDEDKPVPSDSANVIDNCIITYYCCEKRSHICGTGDGITATGTDATPGRTCAVDPAVIPYGSTVIVDYGDGELHSYIAEDAGAWVAQAHVDICVESHNEALELGRKTATVYWTGPGEVVV